jgi:hypothetical protein
MFDVKVTAKKHNLCALSSAAKPPDLSSAVPDFSTHSGFDIIFSSQQRSHMMLCTYILKRGVAMLNIFLMF